MKCRNMLMLTCAAAMSLSQAGRAADAPATPAASGDADSQMLETVVVTAQKRTERFQDLPLSASVVGESQIRDEKIMDVSELANTVPSFSSHPGNGGYLTIRGLGTESWARTAEGDVAVLVDRVAMTGGANPQNPVNLFDVQRVEVLAGPQSTLFGKNAAAGVINIVTNAPDPEDYEAIAHFDYDNRSGLLAQAVLNAPVTDDSALRVSGHYSSDPHFLYNNFSKTWNHDDVSGGRARYLYSPSDALQVNLIADYSKTYGTGYSWAPVSGAPGSFLDTTLASCGVVPSRDNYSSCLSGNSYIDYENYGASAQVDYKLSNGLTITSLTADRVDTTKNNFDSSSVPINDVFGLNDAFQHQNSFSEELRLTSPSDARFEYVVGLYYLDSHQRSTGDQAGTLNNPLLYCCGFTIGNSFSMRGDSESYAAFGQGTLHLTDALSLIGGLRLTHDSVAADTMKFVTPGAVAPFSDLSPISAKARHTDVSGKLGLQYTINQWMIYATASKGYKGPAINDQAPNPTVPLVVKPELVHNYEIGTKAGLFGGLIQLAASAYYENVTDYQVYLVDPLTAQGYFGNATGVNIRGVDVSLFGPLSPNLFVSTGINYNDGKYGHGTLTPCGPTQGLGQDGCNLVMQGGNLALAADAGGKQLLGSPKWKYVSYAVYHRPIGALEGFLQADATWSDAVSYTAVYDPGANYSSYWMLGGRIGVRSEDGRWSLSLFARNLLDQRVPTNVFDTPVAGYLGAPASHSQYLGPDSFRRIGISLDVDY